MAYFIDEVVEQLDLSAIYDDYRDSRGQPPYQPKMMVKVLIYAVIKGIHSSRKIETALYEDVGFRFLAGNQQPDHWTIAAFRRRHHRALGDLFVPTVKLAQRAGLVKLGHVSLDGTKIKAYTSKHSAMSYGRMKQEEERLRREIDAILDLMEKTDRAEGKKYGHRRGDELPAELATRKARLEAIRRAREELEAEARARAAKEQARRREEAAQQGKSCRSKGDPAKAVPQDGDHRNFTDAIDIT